MTSANVSGQSYLNASSRPPSTEASARPSTSVEDQPRKKVDIDFTRLTPRQVSDIHRKADTDLRPESLHHTLGYTSRQALPGDGVRRALRGVKFTGATATYNQALLKQILGALKSMGADDQTT